jgi:hypothetical protein
MPDVIPRPLLFKYTPLETMASQEKAFINHFRGARRALDFNTKSNLVSAQIALLPVEANILTAPIPALVPIAEQMALYFGVDTKQIPKLKLNLLWYVGFMAKHICALVLPEDRLYNSLQLIAKSGNIEELGARCGYYEITRGMSSYLIDINDELAGSLIYLNFYNRYRQRNGQEHFHLMTVLANVKHLGLALLNEAFINGDGFISLPRMTPKNCAEGLHSFIEHDLGHSFMWIVELFRSKHLRLQNQVYGLVNHYLIAHLVRYPELQVFNLALSALFLIVHEENFLGMRTVFEKTGSPLAPLFPNIKDNHFHHMLFQRWFNQVLESKGISDRLHNICTNPNMQCLETYETFEAAGVDIFDKPDFKVINVHRPEAEFGTAGLKFLQGMADKTNQAFAAFNEVTEHVLAQTTSDGETYNTKLIRARLRL